MNADELLSTSLTKAVSNRLYAGLAVGHPGTHTALVLVEYVPVPMVPDSQQTPGPAQVPNGSAQPPAVPQPQARPGDR